MARVKVWPLRAGLRGFDANDNAIDLAPGVPRWMDADDAHAAAARGDVQLLAGLDTASLKPISTADEVAADDALDRTQRGRKGYRRTDMRAQDRDD